LFDSVFAEPDAPAHAWMARRADTRTRRIPMKREKKQEDKIDDQAIMEEYKRLATPGTPHKLLARMAGSWNTKTRA